MPSSLSPSTFDIEEHKETDPPRYDVQINDKGESLLLQQTRSEPSRWKTNRQKMSGMHPDLSAAPRGEGSLNPRRRCCRARPHAANSQRERCRLSQAFRRTGQGPLLQLILLCIPLEYREGERFKPPLISFTVLLRPHAVFQLAFWPTRS